MGIALVAAVAAAFNLVCAGDTVSMVGDKEPKQSKFSLTIRVDLESKRYCTNDCPSTAPLERVTATEIVFKEMTGVMNSSMKVNRESGAFSLFASVDKTVLYRDGQCERAPFSGFPSIKF